MRYGSSVFFSDTRRNCDLIIQRVHLLFFDLILIIKYV